MDANLKFDAVNYETYKNAKSTRPLWANALLIAGVVFVAGFFAFFINTALGAVFFGVAVLLAVVAGIAALAGVSRK